ncbi:MBL fold metallo-hydrolase [Pontibacter rugosus]
MKIEQFEDKGLAHYSYAILSESQREIVLIDPARNPQPYYAYAEQHQSKIVAVIETHPHADFVSAHLEIHQKTGATIYAHPMVRADYPHQPLDEGAILEVGGIKLKPLHTPGHSPDGISIVLEHEGKDKAVFTGDTLFIGDVGRPDLREHAGAMTAKREELARQLFRSTRDKLMQLEDEVLVYPAHGAGSLCGKGLSNANSSTIGAEKAGNYALQPMSEEAFVKLIVADQPFIPKYFGYNVSLNKAGAPAYLPSLEGVKRLGKIAEVKGSAVIVDARPQAQFKQGHLNGAINIQNGGKFETWLGSIVHPDEQFYLLAESEEALEELISKSAKIGYEQLIIGALVYNQQGGEQSAAFDAAAFKANKAAYTLIDIRNGSETKAGTFFDGAITIPLPELRERAGEIPTDKPVVVHCA